MDPSSDRRPLRKKVDLGRGNDRISSLPDEIVAHILSFLLTQDSVRTSILSSRWETMWASVPFLNFTTRHSDWDDYQFYLRYMSIIDRVLLLHNSSVLRFHLHCTPPIDLGRLNTWISALLVRNIREIDISSPLEMEILLPRRLFTCSILVILKISTDLYFDVPSTIYLPGLKVLHIGLRFPSNELITKLLCSFPVLEELNIRVKIKSEKSIFNICSSFLKTLCIEIYSYEFETLGNMVTVDAPALEFLDVQNDCFVRYNLKNCFSLRKAYVDVGIFSLRNNALEDIKRGNELYMLLIAISSVKYLSLGPRTLDALGYGIEKEWPDFPNITHLQMEIEGFSYPDYFLNWPKFYNATHLVLDVGDFGSTSLSTLLRRVPSLSSLVLKRVPNVRYLYDYEPWKKRWAPICLQDGLKEMEVCKFEGLQSELKLIECLFNSAQVLEKMTLKDCNFNEVSEKEFKAEVIAWRKNKQIKCACFYAKTRSL